MQQNKYWIQFFVYSLSAVIFGLCLSLFVRRLPDISQPRVEKELWVYSGHPVTQSITPKNNGLNVVTVYLRNVALRNQEPFLFELSDSSGVIRSIQLTGYNIGDGDNVRFQFDPVWDSGGNTFTLKFSNSSDQKIAIGVGFSPTANSIAFQAFYRPQNRLSVIKSTVYNFIKSLLQIRFLLYLGVLYLFSHRFSKYLEYTTAN